MKLLALLYLCGTGHAASTAVQQSGYASTDSQNWEPPRSYRVKKTGNNGSVDCNTFCAESRFGQVGCSRCDWSYNHSINRQAPCGVTQATPGNLVNVSCYCSGCGDYVDKKGNNGSVDCDTYCKGDWQGWTCDSCRGAWYDGRRSCTGETPSGVICWCAGCRLV